VQQFLAPSFAKPVSMPDTTPALLSLRPMLVADLPFLFEFE